MSILIIRWITILNLDPHGEQFACGLAAYLYRDVACHASQGPGPSRFTDVKKKKQLWAADANAKGWAGLKTGMEQKHDEPASSTRPPLPLVGSWSWLQPSPAVPTPRQLPCHRRLSPQAKLDWSQMRTWMLNQTENELASTRAAMGFGL